MSSLKQATLCAVGIVMMNANRSSMKVLNALYMKARLKREIENQDCSICN